VPPYNRFERAALQAIQQAVADAADGAASFTWPIFSTLAHSGSEF